MTKLADGLTLEITSRTMLTPDIVRIDLARADGGSLPPFTAGAHIDILVDDGLVRQYSLCNPPAERHRYQIAVLREPQSRGGSAMVHKAFHPGRQAIVGAPRNLFALAPDGGRHILIGGGIGITPIVSMAAALAEGGAPFELFYCCRTPENAAFGSTVEALGGRICFSRHPGAAPLDMSVALASPGADTHVYVCGPAAFMNSVREEALRLGWAESRIHRELFQPAEPLTDEGDQPFDVRIASTGATFTIPPRASVASVLTDAGIDVPVSCEQGVCGTCVTAVLDGVPDHRDSYLTDEERAEGKLFTPCCSRARSPLLLLDL
ncbi:PDR/VanB family oxidoreductase [Sphingobium sp. ZW T5_29]|uniref:PDR/VanB family oxidoreductase n=1 Tax=Sphingobium sp. ZW T5_29 TaxID=3378077 RepID=UPI003852D410